MYYCGCVRNIWVWRLYTIILICIQLILFKKNGLMRMALILLTGPIFTRLELC